MQDGNFEDLLNELFEPSPAISGQAEQQPVVSPNQNDKPDPRSENLRKAYESSLTKAKQVENDAARTQDVNKYNTAANARKEADNRYNAYQKSLDQKNSTETVGMPQEFAI